LNPGRRDHNPPC